jgi:hypothetical protein
LGIGCAAAALIPPMQKITAAATTGVENFEGDIVVIMGFAPPQMR